VCDGVAARRLGAFQTGAPPSLPPPPLLSQVSEAKEASNFAAAYKEAKRCRAYEAYQLLAASVSFSPEAMEQLLSLVREKLPLASSPAVRGKLQQLLQHAARGVAGNPSAEGPALSEFLRALLDGCVAREEAARVRAKAAVAAATSVAPKGAPRAGGCALRGRHACLPRRQAQPSPLACRVGVRPCHSCPCRRSCRQPRLH
jgi:hypothetical protein